MAFITRTTNRLKLSGVDWRAAGCNCSWMGLDIGSAWNVTADVVYPSHFRVDDGMKTAVELGCNWIRLYGCMPTVGHAAAVFPDGVTPNETALGHIDYVVKRARDFGVRLMPVLCDPYGFYVGSIADWSTLLGGNGTDFFTNATVINGFKAALTIYIQRTNPLTGVRYCDDDTIFCWVPGNEIDAPDAWVNTIAAHLKSLAPNQLVCDGRALYAISANSLSSADVDIVENHGYGTMMTDTQVNADIATVAGAKVLMHTEYDINRVRAAQGEDSLADYYTAIEAGWPAIWSDALWNLASHGDVFGPSDNYDNYAGSGNDDGYDSLAFEANKRAALIAARNHHCAMRGISVPAAAICSPPENLGGKLYWRGSAAADTYTIEQSDSPSSGYASHTTGKRDSETPIALPANKYYRVKAVNLDGTPGSAS